MLLSKLYFVRKVLKRKKISGFHEKCFKDKEDLPDQFTFICKWFEQTTNNISTSLTNQVNSQRHIYHLPTFHFSLDSEDDFRSGCRNVSQSHPKQSFSGLLSAG